MPQLLIELVETKSPMPRQKGLPKRAQNNKGGNGTGAAPFVCPECSGPLFPDREGPAGQVKCLVGHSFAPGSLSELHRDALERTLFTAIRMLRERASIPRHLARKNAGDRLHRRFQESADTETRDEKLLRDILERI
jgi:two-component system chemotaxis response regulator CheB